jgi:hypothetical protein
MKQQQTTNQLLQRRAQLVIELERIHFTLDEYPYREYESKGPDMLILDRLRDEQRDLLKELEKRSYPNKEIEQLQAALYDCLDEHYDLYQMFTYGPRDEIRGRIMPTVEELAPVELLMDNIECQLVILGHAPCELPDQPEFRDSNWLMVPDAPF